MSGGEASVRKGMERSRLGKPSLSQYESARPVDPVFLAPSANGTPPESKHPIPKHTQTREVSRYRVVVEVAFVALLDKGMKPEMARLTLARKIAAIALILWKKEERFTA